MKDHTLGSLNMICGYWCDYDNSDRPQILPVKAISQGKQKKRPAGNHGCCGCEDDVLFLASREINKLELGYYKINGIARKWALGII